MKDTTGDITTGIVCAQITEQSWRVSWLCDKCQTYTTGLTLLREHWLCEKCAAKIMKDEEKSNANHTRIITITNGD